MLEQTFLAAVDGEWLWPYRAHWDAEAMRALDLAATLAEGAGRLQEALDYLRREAEYCPDDPALTRRIMALAHTIGDGGMLRAAYLQHCRAAREELGVEPDGAVVALYGELMGR
jgi:two-component SAPR family response regulator